MKLHISIRKPAEGLVQVRLFGPLVIGSGAAEFMNTLDVLLGKFSQVEVDMAGVNRLDARGIGCLVWAYADGCAKGSRVTLRNLPPLVRELLVIVKLITVFDELPLAA